MISRRARRADRHRGSGRSRLLRLPQCQRAWCRNRRLFAVGQFGQREDGGIDRVTWHSRVRRHAQARSRHHGLHRAFRSRSERASHLRCSRGARRYRTSLDHGEARVHPSPGRYRGRLSHIPRSRSRLSTGNRDHRRRVDIRCHPLLGTAHESVASLLISYSYKHLYNLTTN